MLRCGSGDSFATQVRSGVGVGVLAQCRCVKCGSRGSVMQVFSGLGVGVVV